MNQNIKTGCTPEEMAEVLKEAYEALSEAHRIITNIRSESFHCDQCSSFERAEMWWGEHAEALEAIGEILSDWELKSSQIKTETANAAKGK